MQDILNNRLNRLRYGPSVPTSTEKRLARRQQLRDNDISQIHKGLVVPEGGKYFLMNFLLLQGLNFSDLLQLFLLMIVLSGQMI